MWKKIFILLLTLMVTACGYGPETQTIAEQFQTRLDNVLGKGVVKVESLNRRGSSPDHTAREGETRRIIYFEVELVLQRDFTVGRWEESAGVNLLSILGAGPTGVKGLNVDGNRAGDRIHANASAIFAQDGQGDWTLYGASDFQNPTPVAKTIVNFQPVLTQERNRLVDLIDAVPLNQNASRNEPLEREVRFSAARVQAVIARTEGRVAIATGSDTGEYFSTIRAVGLAGLKADVLPHIIPLRTDGSIDNLRLLRDGTVDFAMVQADIASLAKTGRWPFDLEGPMPSLRAVTSLYPEVVHMVVRHDSNIHSLNDLKGKTIAIGPRGSSVNTTIRGLLSASGLEPDKDYTTLNTSFEQGLEQLASSQVDAVAHVIGLPAMSLRRAMLGQSLRILPVAMPVDQLSSDYIAYTIPANMYHEQTEPIATVSVASLLVTRSDVPSEQVTKILEQLYLKHHDFVAVGANQASFINIDSARQGVSIQFHATAQLFFDTIAKCLNTQTPCPISNN